MNIIDYTYYICLRLSRRINDPKKSKDHHITNVAGGLMMILLIFILSFSLGILSVFNFTPNKDFIYGIGITFPIIASIYIGIRFERKDKWKFLEEKYNKQSESEKKKNDRIVISLVGGSMLLLFLVFAINVILRHHI
ncbi:hypothetical protein [Aureibacter tunicatorum]|uniref:Uncharacterized protein n=1 Tax=Aureibacter tunicatorum TaxID=866807 RepID=A0AAE3XNU6_9BACT|nr:hypothetical protein [Aureibacter tunicatorum]MDR6239310.1 hypothetical protein [Aureibacter tunicatorum]BDD04766.1 hypothetical protein AUTU_22490 [Aureibacter tunicatorum]